MDSHPGVWGCSLLQDVPRAKALEQMDLPLAYEDASGTVSSGSWAIGIADPLAVAHLHSHANTSSRMHSSHPAAPSPLLPQKIVVPGLTNKDLLQAHNKHVRVFIDAQVRPPSRVRASVTLFGRRVCEAR